MEQFALTNRMLLVAEDDTVVSGAPPCPEKPDNLVVGQRTSLKVTVSEVRFRPWAPLSVRRCSRTFEKPAKTK